LIVLSSPLSNSVIDAPSSISFYSFNYSNYFLGLLFCYHHLVAEYCPNT
jgi:hypothetical protein